MNTRLGFTAGNWQGCGGCLFRQLQGAFWWGYASRLHPVQIQHASPLMTRYHPLAPVLTNL
jgi:hypothetical protein